MDLAHLTYRGPRIDDADLLARLPQNLRSLLVSINGFIQFHGGLHIRGACLRPRWHSLRSAWLGEDAFHMKYARVRETDIPFAQDCLGDQFLLREGKVHRLQAETGDVDLAATGLAAFLEAANADPVGFLRLEPLLRLQNDGGSLEPGQLILAYPPYCTREASGGVSLRAVPAEELLDFHAGLAARLPSDGAPLRLRIAD